MIKETIEIEIVDILVSEKVYRFIAKIYRNKKLTAYKSYGFINDSFYTEEDIKNGIALKNVIEDLKYTDLI